jgi:hypothetical protein
MEEKKEPADRREFFKTVGRGLVLGLTGAGVAYLAKTGRLDPTAICINEHGPCTRCTMLPSGCSLPKAVTYRKEHGHASGS